MKTVRALLDRARALAGAIVDRIRVDTAIVLLMIGTLLAHPREVIGFFADLFGIP